MVLPVDCDRISWKLLCISSVVKGLGNEFYRSIAIGLVGNLNINNNPKIQAKGFTDCLRSD